MRSDDLLILKGNEVLSLLEGRELELIQSVRQAYEVHARGQTSLPHSTFLLFPQAPRNRIIALPSYLGDGFQIAGMKWIASFPGNHEVGLDRASAVMILNSAETGVPTAIFEGSIISAKRTAASAALAASWLHRGSSSLAVGIIGCGLINFEIVRFLRAVFPELQRLLVFDTSAVKAVQFSDKCHALDPQISVSCANDIETVLQNTSLISFATTASQPHVRELPESREPRTILHISLRDLAPELILSCDNVVDDSDHVSRAQTSIHLAEQLCGHRGFIRSSLGDVLLGRAQARSDNNSTLVFSPFGLGILDIAVGKLVYELALQAECGTVIDSFLPVPWLQRTERQES